MDAPLDRSATWPYDDGEPGRFSYARADHPTGAACEEALGALDGGHAVIDDLISLGRATAQVEHSDDLSAEVILAQVRSIIADLLALCGMDPLEATDVIPLR